MNAVSGTVKLAYEKHEAQIISEFGSAAKYNENGCCPLHPHVLLRTKNLLGGWKNVKEFCPFCSELFARDRLEWELKMRERIAHLSPSVLDGTASKSLLISRTQVVSAQMPSTKRITMEEDSSMEEGVQTAVPAAVASSLPHPFTGARSSSNRKKWILLGVVTIGVALAVGLGVDLSSKKDKSSVVQICHFPPDSKSNFSTLNVTENTVAAHLEHGDLMGSCEENCLDICFGEDSVLINASIPVQECVQRCQLDWNSGVAVVISDSTPKLEIVSCNSSSVGIQGLFADDIVPGLFFINLYGDIRNCTSCSPLFRVVESVTTGMAGTKILSTKFASVGEILGNDVVSPLIRDEPLEPMAGCPHSGVDNGRKLVANHAHQRQLPSVCSSAWLVKNTDGQCRYTNCFVGKDGNPENCFECKKNCDNGCGPAAKILGQDLSFSGNFGLFDFGEACCNHDHCWSSTFSRATCDLEFYDDMRSQCPPVVSALPALLISLPVSKEHKVAVASCHILAIMFFVFVNGDEFGTSLYADAQSLQQAHEKTDECVAARNPSKSPTVEPTQAPTQDPSSSSAPARPRCPNIMGCRAADGACDLAYLREDGNCICPGSCTGDSCTLFYPAESGTLDVASESCQGSNNCWANNMTIGEQSCNGNTDTCNGADLCIDSFSCNGAGACYSDNSRIDSFSCNGAGACTFSDSNVGANSCNGEGACGGERLEIGSFSCNGNSSCMSIEDGVRIGDHSCGNESSCVIIQVPVTIGSSSCNGGAESIWESGGACNYITVSIGDGSCNCANCCSCRSSAPVGNFQCNDDGFACNECGGL